MQTTSSAFFESHNINVSIETISPIQASKMLEEINVANRKISTARVLQYKTDMQTGDWKFNGDVIRIDENGVLIDGQHRLTAVAQSGIPFEFLVVRGIQSKDKHTIDSGKSRTGGDALAIQANVAFCDSHIINGAIHAFERYKKNGYGESSGSAKLTNSQVLESYSKHRELIDKAFSIMKSDIPMTNLLVKKVDLLFLYMTFIELDESDAKAFMTKVFTGVGIVEAKSTEKVLRDMLLDSKANVNKRSNKILVNSIFKSWNSLRNGRPIRTKSGCLWSALRDKTAIAK